MLTSFLKLIFTVAVSLSALGSMGFTQNLTEEPELKVIERPTYTVYMRNYEDGKVMVYTRVYKDTSTVGGYIHNMITVQDEQKEFVRALIVEDVREDNSITTRFSLDPSPAAVYFISMERFSNGMEAIIVRRVKDAKFIAVIHKKKSGEWDTEYNKELHDLVRKLDDERGK